MGSVVGICVGAGRVGGGGVFSAAAGALSEGIGLGTAVAGATTTVAEGIVAVGCCREEQAVRTNRAI
jgi:hypothetical protein